MKIPAAASFPLDLAAYLGLLGLLVGSGCRPVDESGPRPAAAPKQTVTQIEAPAPEPVPDEAPPPASAERNSFDEVTARLDRGGNLFMYLGTEKWLGRVSDDLVELKELFAAVPGVSAEELAEVDAFFGIAGRLLRKSGLEEISGVGLSGLALAPGRYRTKIFAHHYPGQGQGFIWRLPGGDAHALRGLDLLPRETRLAGWADFDLGVLWTALATEVEAVGTPEVKAQLQQFPAMFKALTGMELYAVLDSLGGEYGFGVLLDGERPVSMPVGGRTIEMPRPDILLATRLKDQSIFDRVAELFSAMPNVRRTSEGGIHKLLIPPPFPFLPLLQPTMVYDGEYLLIGTGPDLIEQALGVKSGDRPGLRENPEFKALEAAAPEQGNGFAFVSEEFSRAVIALRQRWVATGNLEEKKMAAALEKVFSRLTHAAQTYSVLGRSAEGMLLTSIGNRQPSLALVEDLLLAPAGTIAAIAVPDFIKARESAQRNVCVENLRDIDGATREWALANGRPATDAPHLSGILRHLKDGRLPKCRAGGKYQLGATVTGPPTCSIAGHRLNPDP